MGTRDRIRNLLGPALIESAALFGLALLGARLLFATEIDALPLAATLVPALAVGAGALAYRLTHGYGE